ncbi:UDP-glucose--(glucosyl) LPS a 1,2-glucosyltransferase [Idiomarina loihiensis]|uniref:UDP-glucose:glucosyl LPS a 1,2-glucosyltransferase n=1 Tax=Idiomarina loihiensis (strain ATCC BAA-735 / DSM 15497 / L2-TR) TaxID=283942 RepID=Q5QWU8_IDILO|nr:UDP-glucose--(glucosyl) LPS a 1,2-glucosyltransferase [Idiomarina loihiensis]AAV81396.1 UDP-glucose:glucosyl LPS a 1,2-glucosyltransferase [Idiomarina loihiensis L2TR]AGM35423.1 UDP-glucose:glucosyl LPS a 1,2-glucosyltransferase [Idiomarina loihiensis GSL 199]
MVDNLFVVESPLQALVALELSLRFKDARNGIVYRFVEGREQNNEQIENVISKGEWSFRKKVLFDSSSGLSSHRSIVRELNYFNKTFPESIKQLFIGEFRAQWMHFMRVAVAPSLTVLMDDGAATLMVKREFIDKGIYYPTALWAHGSFMKRLVKRHMYSRFLRNNELQSHLYFASAFIKTEALYPIDFSAVKKLFKSSEKGAREKAVFFFGSKYSEVGIVSREYELAFLERVKRFYSLYDCDLVYCAHRDESDEKLNVLRNTLKFKVVMPETPAEIFLLENNQRILEVSGAYTSVLNNAKVLLPDVLVRAFQLAPEEISVEHRKNIELVYKHFNREDIKLVL